MIALFTIAGLGILALLAEIFKFRKFLNFIVPLGVLAAYCLNFYEWNHEIKIAQFQGMLSFGKVELACSGVILATAFFWFIFANDYFENESTAPDHFALVCFAITGAIMLVSFTNMTMLFLGVEILSIPLYVLAASRKNDIASNEAGFKYFLMGAFASGFLLFGIALIYGATGSFDLATIYSKVSEMKVAATIPSFFYVGVLMMLIAMCFKIAAAPFHFWSPDVYQGSPTVITAFMGTIVKTAGVVAFLFQSCFRKMDNHSRSNFCSIFSCGKYFCGNTNKRKKNVGLFKYFSRRIYVDGHHCEQRTIRRRSFILHTRLLHRFYRSLHSFI